MKKTFLIALALISYGLKAQDVMTFTDCLNQAMSNNLTIKNADFDEKIAVYQRRNSYGKILPSIVATAENRNSWGREVDSRTNLYKTKNQRITYGELNANFNLFSGFQVYNTIRSAQKDVEISQARTQLERNGVIIDLAQRFITILYLQELILANEEQIKSSAKQLEIADLKFNSGVIAESELFKIKALKATEELSLLNSENDLANNMMSLKRLMNMPLDKEIVLVKPELKLDKKVLDDEDPASISEKVLPIYPSYRLSLLEEKKARLQLAIARSSRYPTVGMRLLYRSNYSPTDFDFPFDMQLDQNTSKGIRFYLSVPIFSQFDNYAKIKVEKMRYKKSQLATQIEHERLSQEVLKAIADAKTAFKKTESMGTSLEFSKKSYDADALKFEAGKININELNISKSIFNSSQADLIQAKYQLLFNNALIRFYLGEEFSL